MRSSSVMASSSSATFLTVNSTLFSRRNSSVRSQNSHPGFCTNTTTSSATASRAIAILPSIALPASQPGGGRTITLIDIRGTVWVTHGVPDFPADVVAEWGCRGYCVRRPRPLWARAAADQAPAVFAPSASRRSSSASVRTRATSSRAPAFSRITLATPSPSRTMPRSRCSVPTRS